MMVIRPTTPGRGPDDLDTGAITRIETTSDAASAAIPSADPAGDDHVALPVAFDGSHDDQADAADTEEDAGATSVASGPGGMSWRRSVHLATWVIGM